MRRRPIETTAVTAALRELLYANARAAADENVLVARDEAGDLHSYLFAVQQRMRDEGGSGTRVRVGDLVERAMGDAMAVWDRVNPPDAARDHRWLALDEIAAITAIDPALGELTQQAVERARVLRGDGQEPADLRAYFETYDFDQRSLHRNSVPGGDRIDARPGQPGRADVPAPVLVAFDFMYRVEASDYGSVSLHRSEAEAEDGVRWVVYVTTDGDDAYLEILDDAGTSLHGARLSDHRILAWDEFPGRVRLSAIFTRAAGFVTEEGLSEPDERAAAGQPPADWAGEAALDGTRVYPQGVLLGRIEFGDPALPLELREIATAAIDQLWELPLRQQVQGDAPVVLGPEGVGRLSVGSFTRSTTGETYAVANWRDRDDASFVLYYRRVDAGLELVISQFDN